LLPVIKTNLRSDMGRKTGFAGNASQDNRGDAVQIRPRMLGLTSAPPDRERAFGGSASLDKFRIT
jgi:hypothetical protein